MKKGPAVFLAQFLGKPPFKNLREASQMMASLGFTGVQIPGWDPEVIDLQLASDNDGYGPQLTKWLKEWGITDGATEIAMHLPGQLMAVHPTYKKLFEGFAPEEFRGSLGSMQAWAQKQLILAIRASARMGLKSIPTFSGSLLWAFIYPWPQRPNGLVEMGFTELARRWRPVLDEAEKHGIKLAFELHPGEDVHDGATFEMFLKATGNHPAVGINFDPSHFVLMGLDYLQFIDQYHKFIYAYHVKDALQLLNGTCSMYGGFLPWGLRSGNFLSLGDGSVDFVAIEQRFTQYGLDHIPRVLEWECHKKGKLQGATEGARHIKALLEGNSLPPKTEVIPHQDGSFDDFAAAKVDEAHLRALLGIDEPI